MLVPMLRSRASADSWAAGRLVGLLLAIQLSSTLVPVKRHNGRHADDELDQR